MIRSSALALLLAVAVAAPASAKQWSAAQGIAFLARHEPVPANVTVHWASCPGEEDASSCALPASREVYIEPDLRDGVRWDWLAPLAHELGHIWDYDHLTAAARGRYAAFLRRPVASWINPDPAGIDERLPAGEVFADAYALCALGSKYRRTAEGGDSYLAPEGEELRRSTVAATCWLVGRERSTRGEPWA